MRDVTKGRDYGTIKTLYVGTDVLFTEVCNIMSKVEVRLAELVADRDNLVLVQNTKKAVIHYIDWVLNSEDTRAIWIRDVLESGILKGKPIVYYRRLGEPSHADALNYLINHYY